MATESVATVMRNFWDLNGKYQIAPETTNLDKINDAGCLLSAAEANLVAVLDILEDTGAGNLMAQRLLLARMLYGVQYQMQMAKNLIGATRGAKEDDHGHV